MLRDKTMKKIHFTLLIALSSVFFSAGAIAQNQPLACQSDARGGMYWENGRWVVSRFTETKFILVQSKNGLTEESVAKAMGALLNLTNCSTAFANRVSCSDQLGGHLYFDPAALKGGISIVYGSTQADTDKKDTMTLTAFSCTPF
jgi:hypothetical protein